MPGGQFTRGRPGSGGPGPGGRVVFRHRETRGTSAGRAPGTRVLTPSPARETPSPGSRAADGVRDPHLTPGGNRDPERRSPHLGKSRLMWRFLAVLGASARVDFPREGSAASRPRPLLQTRRPGPVWGPLRPARPRPPSQDPSAGPPFTVRPGRADVAQRAPPGRPRSKLRSLRGPRTSSPHVRTQSRRPDVTGPPARSGG